MRFVPPLLLLALLFGGTAALAAGVELRPDYPILQERALPISALVGESLTYDIAFLWFDHLAEGRLSFTAGEVPGTYRAVLEARTLGVAAWLTSDRVQRYVSMMEVAPDGGLRTLSFESHIIKGQGEGRSDTTRLYTFDYGNQKIRYQRARKGKFYKDQLLPMSSQDPPNDILTAFYNFRAGYFGPLKPGASYTIPTFSREGDETIRVEILTDDRRPDEPFFPRRGMLGRVFLDKEVLDTEGGAVYVWLDDLGRPLRGMVENVIGLGHVRGKIRK